MKKKVMTAYVAAILAQLVLFYSIGSWANPEDEAAALPSPYFIDELHCEGFEHIPKVTWPYNASAQQESEIVKASIGEMCENFLGSFGVTKYKWYSPSDLQRVASLLRRDTPFEEVEMVIRKSELRNHVHIFLKIKPASDQTTVRFNSQIDLGRVGEGARSTHEISLDYQKRSELPYWTGHYGFLYRQSSAETPVADLDKFNLTADEKERLSRTDYHLTKLSMDSGTPFAGYGLSFTQFWDLLLHNINSEGKDDLDFNLRWDLDKSYSSVVGKASWGISVLWSLYGAYKRPVSGCAVSSCTRLDQGLLAGLTLKSSSGSPEGDYSNFFVGLYRDANGTSMAYSNIFLEYGWVAQNSWWRDQTYWKIESKDLVDMDLPHLRYPLPTRRELSGELGVRRNFRISDHNLKAQAFVGYESLNGPNVSPADSELETFSRAALPIGIGCNYQVPGWDINVSLKLGSRTF